MAEPLTVIVPCFNEEENIQDCLESVTWADEILVMDSLSTDRTLEIARRYPCRIIQRECAVAVVHHVADLVAVGPAPDAAVVARGEDGAVAHDDRAHVLAVAGRAGRRLASDVHEVGVPVDSSPRHRGGSLPEGCGCFNAWKRDARSAC